MGRVQRAPTMRDVAELAGVSVQTVSCVVNQKPGITEDTAARVRTAIAELGYRPYSVARSLRTHQTRSIAVVVTDIANPSFATMASAAEDCAHRYGYSVVLYNTHDDVEREAGYIASAAERWVDGVLFVSAQDHMNSLATLQAAGIPSVAIDRVPEQHTGLSVTLDNVKAGRLAAEHLIGLGHTRIAHISGPLTLQLARERLGGFQAALAEHGLEPGLAVPEPASGQWECAVGHEAMRRILESGAEYTGIFCANDRMAIGAVRAAGEKGLRVPEDISVVGLDDIEVAAFMSPPLTTVRQSFTDMATLGVHLLLDILGDRPVGQTHIKLEPQLVVRQSTGPRRPGPHRRARAGSPAMRPPEWSLDAKIP